MLVYHLMETFEGGARVVARAGEPAGRKNLVPPAVVSRFVYGRQGSQRSTAVSLKVVKGFKLIVERAMDRVAASGIDWDHAMLQGYPEIFQKAFSAGPSCQVIKLEVPSIQATVAERLQRKHAIELARIAARSPKASPNELLRVVVLWERHQRALRRHRSGRNGGNVPRNPATIRSVADLPGLDESLSPAS